MAAQDVSQDMRDERTPTAVDRTGDRGGSIGMVLAVALLLVGSVIAFLFVGRSQRAALRADACCRRSP